jgi:hypothetical protein
MGARNFGSLARTLARLLPQQIIKRFASPVCNKAMSTGDASFIAFYEFIA